MAYNLPPALEAISPISGEARRRFGPADGRRVHCPEVCGLRAGGRSGKNIHGLKARHVEVASNLLTTSIHHLFSNPSE